MDIKDKLKKDISDAYAEYNELYEYEESTDFDDAMDGFERKYAEGYADGLQAAYLLIYGEE